MAIPNDVKVDRGSKDRTHVVFEVDKVRGAFEVVKVVGLLVVVALGTPWKSLERRKESKER